MSLRPIPENSSPARMPCDDYFSVHPAIALSERVTDYVLGVALVLSVTALRAYFNLYPSNDLTLSRYTGLTSLPEGFIIDPLNHCIISIPKRLNSNLGITNSQEPTSLLQKIIRWIF